MNTKIRPATLEDIKFLDSLQNKLAVRERHLTPTIKKSGKIKYYNLKKLITSKRALLLVAQDGRKIIGCCFGEIRKNEDWAVFKLSGYIGMMFVEKRYRDKGVGGLLMGEIMKWLMKNKIKDIRLKVYDKNEGAINFYRNCGFDNHILEMIY